MPRGTSMRQPRRHEGWQESVAEWGSARNLLIFGAGALLMMAAGRMAAPVAGRAVGSLRAMSGGDPFEALAQDHRKVLALFDAIETTDESAAGRRATMLFQLKRMLTAHALAEEDIVYPMLRDDARRREQATRLYREHAEVKVKLFELEHKPKDDPTWMEDIRALRVLLEEHMRQEEQVEFPKLRNALDETQRTLADMRKNLAATSGESEIFKRQVWATYQTDFVGLHLIEFFGDGHMMWGSDYPHPDSTWPFSKNIIEKDTGHLSPEMKKKLIHDNAAALYGL